MNIQSQVSQLKLQFAGPLVSDAQVATLADLLTLSYNYTHKLVWVVAEKAMYCLKAGTTGTSASDWEPYGKQSITPHSQLNTYKQYDCVYTSNGLYVAIQDVPVNIAVTNTSYWQHISSSAVEYYLAFTNQSSLTISTATIGISHPVIQIYIGNKLVDADVQYNSTTDNWVITFYENGVATAKTGYIIMK